MFIVFSVLRWFFPVFTCQKLISCILPTFTEAFHAHILNGQLHSYHIRPNFAFPIFVATRFMPLILGAPSLEGNLTLFYWFLSHCLLPIKWGGKGRPNLSQHGSWFDLRRTHSFWSLAQWVTWVGKRQVGSCPDNFPLTGDLPRNKDTSFALFTPSF